MYNTSITELYTPALMVTAHAVTPLTKGQFVAIAADNHTEHPNVTVAAKGATTFGIAATDTAAGGIVTIQRGNARCFRLPTTATIAAGAALQVGTNGEPVTATDGETIAYALHPSTGEDVDVTLA